MNDMNLDPIFHDNPVQLSDVTIVIPIRVESEERKNNLETILNVLNRDFSTSIIVREGDKKQKFYPPEGIDNLIYEFVYDEEDTFNRTRHRNQLLHQAKTPYVGVWDTDAIAIPEQVAEAVNCLRQNKAVMVFPYDGRFYMLNEVLSKLFRKYMDYNILASTTGLMRSMHGYNSLGGAFIVNKDEYLNAGGENENFCGWDAEDDERVKRMEVLGLAVFFAQGPMYHLWHPKLQTGRFANEEIERRNRKAFLKTCASDKDTLLKEISTWKQK